MARVPRGERAVRDPLFAVRGEHARALPLIVTVIQQSEALLRARGPLDGHRALLERRLAEDYVELELRCESSGRDDVAARARVGAIRYYTVVLRDAPDEPDVDEVLYERGLEREAAGDDAGAARDYREVLQRFPDGRMAPYAWYGMGVVTRRVTPDLVDLAHDDFAHAAASGTGALAEAARSALAR